MNMEINPSEYKVLIVDTAFLRLFFVNFLINTFD